MLNTDHDIPSPQDCADCHQGNTDIILGFDAIQLSDAQQEYAFGHGPTRQSGEWTLTKLLAANKLSHPIAEPRLPGNELEQKVLGYLHANCGNCHNPLGLAAEREAKHLKLRHKLAFDSVDKTHVYQTAVNQKTQNFTVAPYIVAGAADEELALFHSAAFIRVLSSEEEYRMPPIAREKVDYQALALLRQWHKTLPSPNDLSINKDNKKKSKTLANTSLPDRSKPLTGAGLQVEVQFFQPEHIAKVFALYWPEDNSLNQTPVMDHQDGYFSEKLILGKQGSTMSLRNSDDVGHTIYVKDKQHKINWQLNYMPPGSEFEQELFWQDDIFVEMKCRLHLYMSAWVGSITSQYHQVVELAEGELSLIHI